MPSAAILQNAWVVPDLDAAISTWHATTGVAPFLVIRHIKLVEHWYRGSLTKTDFSVAVAQAGGVQLEFIEQHDDTPSCYRDLVPKGSLGFHHIAAMVPDFDAEVARYAAAGFENASWGHAGEVRFAYIDTSRALGCMVELIEDRPGYRGMLSRVADMARDWTGAGPLTVEMEGSSSGLPA